MSIYEEMQGLSKSLLSEFQQGKIEYVSVATGGGTIDDPGAPVETTYPAVGTAKGVSFKFVKDGQALSTDLTVVIAPISNVVPSPNDFVKIDNIKYKIVHDISVPAAGVKVVWKFIIRKGA